MELSDEEKKRILERDGHRCKGCENATGHLVIRLGDWTGSVLPLWEWKCICSNCHENNLSQSFLNLDIDFDNPDRERQFKKYYKSEVWIRKRERTRRRDKGVCQHCLDRQAVQVHYLTYDHFKHEFLFELSSICYEDH